MKIDDKEAIPLKLYCPLKCGGFIENEMLIYLLEGDELYIFGKCGECGQMGSLTVSLIEVISQCPCQTVM